MRKHGAGLAPGTMLIKKETNNEKPLLFYREPRGFAIITEIAGQASWGSQERTTAQSG